jgi:tellurite methyltransferase
MAGRTSSDPDPRGDWSSYYEKTGHRLPRRTLLRALDAFDREGMDGARLAADLGCGSGRDTIEILRRGWPVIAIDAAPEAMDKLVSRPDLPKGAAVETQISRYEDMVLPSCDLVNAAFSLPLCPAAAFSGVWDKIVGALRTGGRFSGQFYGDRDSWAGNPEMTHLTRKEALTVLDPFTIELFEEEEDDSVTPRGTPKHWHIFHIVARKQ